MPLWCGSPILLDCSLAAVEQYIDRLVLFGANGDGAFHSTDSGVHCWVVAVSITRSDRSLCRLKVWICFSRHFCVSVLASGVLGNRIAQSLAEFIFHTLFRSAGVLAKRQQQQKKSIYFFLLASSSSFYGWSECEIEKEKEMDMHLGLADLADTFVSFVGARDAESSESVEIALVVCDCARCFVDERGR